MQKYADEGGLQSSVVVKLLASESALLRPVAPDGRKRVCLDVRSFDSFGMKLSGRWAVPGGKALDRPE